MKLRTRIFWNLLPIGIAYGRIKGKAGRFYRQPDFYNKVERNEMFHKFSAKMLKYLGVELEVKGLDNVPNGPCLIVPNHSTYIDPLIISYALSHSEDKSKEAHIVNFIARSETKKKKSVARIANLVDTYFLDFSKPREVLTTLFDFGKHVKQNKSAGVIFAEGTRTRDGKLGEFKTGAFKIAQSCFLSIIPVTINNACNALDKNRNGKLKVSVEFHPEIKPLQYQTVDASVLAERVRNDIASTYKDQVITSNETIKNTYSKRDKNRGEK